VTTCDLLVLGGGPAGIAAAQRAARRGLSVTLLERADHIGGASASFEVAGVRVDHGSHRLHRTIEPRILTELHRLLGDDLQLRQRNGRIRLAGRWLAFPLRAADLASSLPPAFAARAAWDTVTGWTRTARTDTFAEVVRARLGRAMLERFYGPYAVKLWGLPAEELAGEQARRRISADSPWKILRQVVAGADPAARTFRYPRRGFGQLWEALAGDAASAGADIRLDTPVTAVDEVAGRLRVRTPGGELTARHVWSTIPLPALARAWSPAPPPQVVADARALRSRAMVLAYVVVPHGQWTPFDAHYLPESWTPVTRISEPRNYRDDPDAPDGRTVLCAELPCDVGDELWRADDATLRGLVVDALHGAELPVPVIDEVASRRLPNAYPILTPDAPERIDRLEAWAAQRPGLLTFGRQGLFVHDNSHHAMSMAWAAVDALTADGALDAATWAQARQGFRAHVVED